MTHPAHQPDVEPADDEQLTDVDRFQKNYPLNPKDAAEQAAEYLGFMAGVTFDLGDGETWTLPNPSMMDDEQEERYNQAIADVQNEVEKYDREPDELDDDGKVIRKGDVKTPAQINGKVIPSQNVRIAKALMGSSTYAKFKKAGGNANQITIHWQQMNKWMRERAASDSKSRGSAGVVAPVSDPSGV